MSRQVAKRELNSETLREFFNVLKNVANLIETDLKIFKILMIEYSKRKEPISVTELVSKTGLSKSTVERSLAKMYKLGMVDRKVYLRKFGGYANVYIPKSIDDVKRALVRKVLEYCENARKLVDMLDIVLDALE